MRGEAVIFDLVQSCKESFWNVLQHQNASFREQTSPVRFCRRNNINKPDVAQRKFNYRKGHEGGRFAQDQNPR